MPVKNAIRRKLIINFYNMKRLFDEYTKKNGNGIVNDRR